MTKWVPSRHYGLLFGMIILMLLTACASTPQPMQIRADIDALATTDAQVKRRFVILPGNKDIREQDLQFIEFKTYAEKALISRGYVKADNLQDGDLVLFMSYGVSEPQSYQYSYDVPVWYDMGFYPYYRRYRFYPGMTGYYYAQRVENYMVYRRYLTLEAYDMAAYLQQQPPRQLWKITVQSQGQSNDLRLTLPYMVAAMQQYIGSNTQHMVSVVIDEFNPLLKDLLGSQNRVPPAAPQPSNRPPNQ